VTESGETGEATTDDLAGTCRVFRVIRAEEVMPDADGRERPKSSCFSDSREDRAMSVFLEDDLLAAGITDPGLLLAHFSAGSRLSWLPLSMYREEQQIVTRAPIPEVAGHALVRTPGGRRRSSGVRTRLAKASRFL